MAFWNRRKSQPQTPWGPIVGWSPGDREKLGLWGWNASYATIYKSQPAVRLVVDFLARNIAQLNLKTYRKISRTEREEIPDHGLARLIQQPNPRTTRYRMLHGTISDIAIYDVAYWQKVQTGNSRALFRIPPISIRLESSAGLSQWRLADGSVLGLDDVIYFHGYDPLDPRLGTSPLESLRQVLAEEWFASQHRQGFWRNSARREGTIERPLEAPEWSAVARERFRNEWQASMSGSANAGKTAILEEGMKWNPDSWSPRDSEFIAGRKFTREEVARAYHIPPPMVGILENATFSNITQQHKMLYQDTLGPWLAMIEQELILQLLGWFTDTAGVYLEFNIEEKLQGLFEEQAALLTSAVGRPWMLVDEARSIRNLPKVEGGEELTIPLNVLVGNQPAPNVMPVVEPKSIGTKAIPPRVVARHSEQAARYASVLAKFFRRQERELSAKLGFKGLDESWSPDWDTELEDILIRHNLAIATAAGTRTARSIGGEYNQARTQKYVSLRSGIAARNINGSTKAELDLIHDDAEAFAEIFSKAATSRAAQIAETLVTAYNGFGREEAAQQNGLQTKTWLVTSPNSRHPELDGETVNVGEQFSNGLAYPGDSAGDAADTAGCTCLLEVS